MLWHGQRAFDAARRGAVKGLKDWADEVYDVSQREVPVAPTGGGHLKDSGRVDVDEGALQAAVSYEGGEPTAQGRSPVPRVDVAILVHEATRFRHTIGKAKYLEDPLNATTKSGPEKVRAAISGEIG